MAKDESTVPALSERDMQLLSAAMLSTKEEFKIDYEKFAVNGKFKNANSARASWHGLKNKLDKIRDLGAAGAADGEDDSNEAPSDTTKGKGKKRKAAGDEDGQDGDDGAEKTAVKPKAKGKGKKAKATEDGDGAEETTAKPKAKRGRAAKKTAKKGDAVEEEAEDGEGDDEVKQEDGEDA